MAYGFNINIVNIGCQYQQSISTILASVSANIIYSVNIVGVPQNPIDLTDIETMGLYRSNFFSPTLNNDDGHFGLLVIAILFI